MDREIIDPLLGLLDQCVAEDLPGQVLGDAADLLQRLIDRHRTDRHRAVAHDPFARVVDVAPGRQVHHRVRAPADRPDHLVDLLRHVGGDGRVADIGVDLDQEVAADRHRLGFGVVDVAGDDRAAARHLLAHEFGRHVIGDRGTPILSVADIFGEARAAEILALGDIFHLGRDDALAGIMHLADVHARLGAQHLAADIGEGLDTARAIRAELAIILGLHLALEHLLDIAAAADPVAAQLGKAGHDVDTGLGIGIGPRRIVDAHRWLARRGLERDLAHRHLVGADMDLAAAANRAGGDGKLGTGGNIGHLRFTPNPEARAFGSVPAGSIPAARRPLPPPVLAGSGSTGRGRFAASQPHARSPGDGMIVGLSAAGVNRSAQPADSGRAI